MNRHAGRRASSAARRGDGPNPRYFVDGVYRPPRWALRPPPNWRARIAIAIAVAGLVTLIAGSIAARTGVFRLSWDRHHLLLQLIGIGISAAGIALLTASGNHQPAVPAVPAVSPTPGIGPATIGTLPITGRDAMSRPVNQPPRKGNP